jgi:acyl-CoA synthetase (NDP forming)
MDTFFYPRSMVVIGASATKKNLGQIVLLNNIRNGYEGALYGVGSQEGEIEGVHIYKDVESLPETPDVAVILTPARTVPAIMEACGRKGIRHIVIESGGFSEYSHGDHSLESEVLAAAGKYGMKVIGPNCVGIVNFDIKIMMPFGFFKNIPPPGGRVALIVQSGGIGGTYLRGLSGYGVTPGKFVAVGNKLQLDEVDFLDYFLNDEKTDIITMYLEGFSRGREFFDLALRSDKPIIVQKSNRSPSSAKIALSHTTALSSSDEVVNGAFRQAAVIRAEDELEFINAVKIVRLPHMKGRRVAVLSRSGGHAVLSADACAKYGFEMVPFSRQFIKKIKTMYHTRVIAHQNPLDLGEIFDYTIFTGILEEALKLAEVDGVLFNHLYASDYESGMSRTFLSGVQKLVEKYGKPVSLAMISDRKEVLDVSMNHPYPIFTSPLEAAKALHVSASYYERKTARDNRANVVAYGVDKAAIEDIMKKCRDEGRIPLTDEALAVSGAAGIHPIKGYVVSDEESAGNVFLGFPVALKLLSRDASHKSDVGGVMIGISTKEALLAAFKDMKEVVGRLNPAPAVEGFLIQEMAKPGFEFFIGGRKDPVFGPIVMAGLGGLFIEIFKDTAIRMAPVTEPEARDMLRDLRAFPLLQGARGKEPADIDALVEVICRVSSLMTACPDISEMDINPVIVHSAGQGVSIVDARVFF